MQLLTHLVKCAKNSDIMLKFLVILLVVLAMSDCRVFRPAPRRHRDHKLWATMKDLLRQDHHGCDILVIGAITHCGPKGKCCDEHDACINKYEYGGLLGGKETLSRSKTLSKKAFFRSLKRARAKLLRAIIFMVRATSNLRRS
jgi:hypothetical protein